MPHTITYDRNGFILGGRRTFLLNGTIPYYRHHPTDWRHHLLSLRASGYTGVDVYVPWNYHERTPGRFDFTTGNRNLGAFLDAIHAAGLYAYLRPGPYICNEWDGGGLPQWLQRTGGLRIRENEPGFIGYAVRYLREVCGIARARQFTRGGPVILFAVENEYDLFPVSTDRYAYIRALRDAVRGAGIEVPLTACVGGGAAIRWATGLVEDVVPTPNYYLGSMVEQKVEDMRRHLLAQRFHDGSPMDGVPVFVTEMGRRESDQLRVMAGGVKGLGPFNFSGGSHAGFWNGLTNWGGVTPISSAVDFGGMVAFDGTVTPNFWDTRRTTAFIHAFEKELLACESTHSCIADAPRVDNPALGTPHYDTTWRRVYSLVDGDLGFTFLVNETGQEQSAAVTPCNQPPFPRRGKIPVAPGSTRVVCFGIPLARAGLPGTLRFTTANVFGLGKGDDGATLVLYAADGETVELLLGGGWQARETPPGGCRVENEPDGLLVLLTAGPAPRHATLACGDGRLRILWMNRTTMETWNLGCAAGNFRRHGAGVELAADAWRRTELAPRCGAEAVAATPQPVREMKPMEAYAIDRGAAWYCCEVATPALAPGARLVLERALDIVGVYWDGVLAGTQWGVGEPLAFQLPACAAGSHRLDIRTETWGHANYHDTSHYATRLDSKRGVVGAVTLDGAALEGTFTVLREPEEGPCGGRDHATAPCGTAGLAVEAGGMAAFTHRLAGDLPYGAVLTLEGVRVHGEVWLEDWMPGRFVLGLLVPREEGGGVFLAGGPGNRFFLPGALARKGAELRLVVRAGEGGGRITRATLTAVESFDPCADR